MSDWTYKLTMINNTKRAIKNTSFNISYGKATYTTWINPGSSGEIRVEAYSGPVGLEFDASYADVPPQGEKMYGTFRIDIDIPYFKSKNKSECTKTGSINIEGFDNLKGGQTAYSGTITINSTEESEDDDD